METKQNTGYLAVTEKFITFGVDKQGKVKSMTAHNFGIDMQPQQQSDVLIHRHYLEARRVLKHG